MLSDYASCSCAAKSVRLQSADSSTPSVLWLMPKKITLAAVLVESECNYPSPFDELCLDQSTQRLARHAGLTQIRRESDRHRTRRLVQPASLAQP